MFRNRRRKKQGQPPGPVGTEAKAAAAKEKNARNFHYPSAGFVCPVEHTLLYAMLTEPTIYPEEVIKNEIDSEDFEDYLPLNTPMPVRGDEDAPASLAQLSVLLAVSSAKFPSHDETALDEFGFPNERTINERKKKKEESIPYILSKKIINTVVRYADEHNLDRSAEIDELTSPVNSYLQKRIAKNEISESVPMYVGYTASLLTANPLFFMVGAAVTVGKASNNANAREERINADALAAEAARRGDAEKTGLLDENYDD